MRNNNIETQYLSKSQDVENDEDKLANCIRKLCDTA